MSLAVRIADQTLTLLNKSEPSFGSLLASDRKVSFLARLTGADKDAIAASIVTLNSRLATPCDLVLQSTDSSYPQALRLLGDGAATVLDQWRYEFGDAAVVQVESPCAPYATPANRVYPNPCGDEFPTADDVVAYDDGSTYQSEYSCASGGRWRVYATTSARGMIHLYGDCSANEVLSVECDYEVESVGTGGVYVTIAFLNSSDAVTNTWGVAYKAAVGAGHSVVLVRSDSNDVRFRVQIYAADSASACVGYVWNVEVGRKMPAAPRTVPTGPSSYGTTTLPAGWTHNTVANATWDYGATASGYFALAIGNAVTSEPYMYEEDAHAVVPGRTYGAVVTRNVTAWTAGTAYCKVYWYDSDGVYLSASTVDSKTSATGSATTNTTVTAPANAVWGRMFLVTSDDANLDVRWTACDWGEHLCETPGQIHLTSIEGEAPAPLEVWGDVDPESDAHSVWLGVMPAGVGPYIWQAEALSWSGTDDAAATDAAFYPGSGNTGWKNSGTNVATGTIDASKCTPGTYLLLVRGMSNNASYTSSYACSQSNAAHPTTALTTPAWLSLGQVTLPPKKTHPGTAANLTVTMVSSNASGVASADCYLALPLNLGGYAYYHDSTVTDVISQFDVIDGQILLDSTTDMTDCGGGAMLATADSRLIVVAEESASDETTHLVNLSILHTPRYGLWR